MTEYLILHVKAKIQNMPHNVRVKHKITFILFALSHNK